MPGGGANQEDPVLCWRCGHPYAEDTRNVPRAAECAACHADLHVCRMCEFYDTRVARSCRETIAEEVKDKERANFCGYFRIAGGRGPAASDAGAARAQLEGLFGMGPAQSGGPGSPDAARDALEELFGVKGTGKGDGGR
ncbi:MAG: hypothetical protein R3F45_07550 [Gammaproteobacteria bacterium]